MIKVLYSRFQTGVIFFMFSFHLFFNAATADGCDRDTDFSKVQTKYDQGPETFESHSWLLRVRSHTQIQLTGGQLILDDDFFLRLTPVTIKITGMNCDFRGVRIILSNCSGNELGRTIIQKNGQAFLNIPQDIVHYPLKISSPLLAETKTLYHCSKQNITDSQMKSYLRQCRINTSNSKLFLAVLTKWINKSHHINQNIYNRIADLLLFINNDSVKKLIVCENRESIRRYIAEIDTIDRNNPVYINFYNNLGCLLN